MPKGKCPACQKNLLAVNVDSIPIKQGLKSYKGVSLTCPYCRTIISVSFDPYAMAEEIKKKIKGY